MRMVKSIPVNIEQLLDRYEKNGHLTMQASLMGKQSVVYRLQEYCLKVYTPRGKVDGEFECDALMSLQNNHHVPELYAYASGNFVLTEWIDGLNLRQFRITYGHIPHNLIYDMFSTELQQIQAGYRDWDVIRYENLLWTATGEVKRTDFWLCEPVSCMRLRERLQQEIIRKIERIYSGDGTDMEEIVHYFDRHGLTSTEVQEALAHFRSLTPRMALAQ
ncbi:hypothetical protein [Paenibacillus sp. LK1]|uniref:hypothetical protein n=1 Tax=Paenibacillus sp. LK1 TaxID=2053014 RepID=UPI000C192902|nr:hypothetical protein [Paenibacillus sp. LK1]PIH60723.1 hypothetical protein CS562_06525 [Paenibacillus sp. LK1]